MYIYRCVNGMLTNYDRYVSEWPIEGLNHLSQDAANDAAYFYSKTFSLLETQLVGLQWD